MELPPRDKSCTYDKSDTSSDEHANEDRFRPTDVKGFHLGRQPSESATHNRVRPDPIAETVNSPVDLEESPHGGLPAASALRCGVCSILVPCCCDCSSLIPR